MIGYHDFSRWACDSIQLFQDQTDRKTFLQESKKIKLLMPIIMIIFLFLFPFPKGQVEINPDLLIPAFIWNHPTAKFYYRKTRKFVWA